MKYHSRNDLALACARRMLTKENQSVTATATAATITFAASTDAFTKSAETVIRAARTMLRLALADDATRARYVAGRGARAYVAAGLDPALADEAAFDAYVRDLLRDPVLDTTARAELAARALEGYVTHRPDTGARVVAWHRYFGGGSTVVVGRG